MTSPFRVQDFSRRSIQITISNLTSGTVVPAAAKIELLELNDLTITLSLPAKNCAQGHRLALKLVISQDSRRHEIEATGVIKEFESYRDGLDEIRIKLEQVDSESWKKWCAQFENDFQEAVNLFEKLKN